jgi:hypothetical protein
MDVAPPWYELSHPACGGATRGCGGGDLACREAAGKDGYVAISNYSFCHRDEVRTEPSLSGFLLMAVLLMGVGAASVAWRRKLHAQALAAQGAAASGGGPATGSPPRSR